MAVNILIGVGGTGAKVVESALFLLSAGVGPRAEVLVGLVDQDNANGNVARTEQLLNLLVHLRDGFQTPSSRMDWNLEEGGTALFSVPVAPLMPGGAHWRPAPDNLPTLRDIMRHEAMPREEQALFDLLFRGDDATPADEEQTMNLAEGYRGRAHVGAAALVSAIHHDQPEFLARLLELMKRSSGGEEVRIFIAGSLFGGTGAAGFPTIARTLHRLRASGNAQRIQSDKVRIGGALMLPYFSFAEPAEGANVITSAQLLPQARVAIDYYENLLGQEGVFDRLYVAGWEKMFRLGYHEAGRAEQRNPALPPELVAASAVCDFFDLPVGEVASAKPMVAARRDAAEFGWADLPARETLKLEERLGNALRFALWWRYRVEPAIDAKGLFGRSDRPAWLDRLAEKTDWQGEARGMRVNVQDYCRRLLEWAASMRLLSAGVVGSFKLWNSDSFARPNANQPTDPVTLADQRDEDTTRRDLDALIDDARDEQNRPVSSSVVFPRLSKPLQTGKSTNFGKLVAGVHRATRPAPDQPSEQG